MYEVRFEDGDLEDMSREKVEESLVPLPDNTPKHVGAGSRQGDECSAVAKMIAYIKPVI